MIHKAVPVLASLMAVHAFAITDARLADKIGAYIKPVTTAALAPLTGLGKYSCSTALVASFAEAGQLAITISVRFQRDAAGQRGQRH